MSYVLSFDQSTQGTKALLFRQDGRLLGRRDLPHQQIVTSEGWVSHDLEEIYGNLRECARGVIQDAGIDPGEIACIGISNQRETTAAWDRSTGKPLCGAIVWQCARAKEIGARIEARGLGPMVRERTGIPVSPYFPACKMAWILENVPEARKCGEAGSLCFGTIDSWLLFCMTEGRSYKTDYSNASRTQLFNIHTLSWDEDICRAFGIRLSQLPEVCDSDAVFGTTDLGGLLPKQTPVCGVLGDSHAALFGQNCTKRGMAKATYGTGSSIMMNIGEAPAASGHGLVTSLAWKRRGQVQYVMEGNINYTGAVISWLQKDVGLFSSAGETESLARSANPEDTTYLVPAFSGLGAPYWSSGAKAAFVGMTRTTKRAELVKAAVECIAYQIFDVVWAMEQDSGIRIPVLKVDGGPTRNAYLMQFQSDLLQAAVQCPEAEELSGIGAGYMAGISAGVFTEDVLDSLNSKLYHAQASAEKRDALIQGWHDAVQRVLT